MEYNMDTEIVATEKAEKPALDESKIALAQNLALGKQPSEIAMILSRSTAWVRTHRKDPEVISLVNELQADALASAKAALTTGTVKAVNALMDLLECPAPQIKLSAANSILDRNGIKSHEASGTNIQFNIYKDMDKDELRQNIKARYQVLESDE